MSLFRKCGISVVYHGNQQIILQRSGLFEEKLHLFEIGFKFVLSSFFRLFKLSAKLLVDYPTNQTLDVTK